MNILVIGNGATGLADNTVLIGNASTTKTHIMGDLQIDSDRWLKKNIKPYKSALKKLLKIEGKQYNLRNYYVVRPCNVYGPGDNFDPKNAI